MVIKAPLVMGILNITTDSFYSESRAASHDHLVDKAQHMIAQGADWLDIGGESTRPGAASISVQQELDRVIPAIECLRARFDIPLSIDTSKPEVMQHAVEAGASMINDIWALRQPNALKMAAQYDVPICLMHMQGEPGTMQSNPHYEQGVLPAIMDFFAQRISVCEKAGIARERLWLDPGIGFGKTLSDNLTILANLVKLHRFDLPLLLGISRKTMIGELLNKAPEGRLYGTLGATAEAIKQKVGIIRTHDVGATQDFLKVMWAIKEHHEHAI